MYGFKVEYNWDFKKRKAEGEKRRACLFNLFLLYNKLFWILENYML